MENISRDKSRAAKRFLANNVWRCLTAFALLTLSACISVPPQTELEGEPWQLPDCDEPACVNGTQIVFTGGNFTKGWIHAWDQNNKIIIGSEATHPQGHIEIVFKDVTHNISSFSMQFGTIESKVPTEILRCFNVNDLKRISWRFDYIPDKTTPPNNHMRLIYLAFDQSHATIRRLHKSKPFGNGHLEILFKGANISWIRIFKGHKQYTGGGDRQFCPENLTPVTN